MHCDFHTTHAEYCLLITHRCHFFVSWLLIYAVVRTIVMFWFLARIQYAYDTLYTMF